MRDKAERPPPTPQEETDGHGLRGLVIAILITAAVVLALVLKLAGH